MPPTFSFSTACDYLDSLINMGVKLGLDNTHRLLRAIDDPQDRLKVVHVAGSNGKGSVCALLASALRHSGYRVGLFTSPHLVNVRERIRVDGRAISEEDFATAAQEVREAATRAFDAATGECITYFEATTAMAFLHFLRAEVDIVVLEVGLGGRLDSTNVVTPLVSVITSIDLEHTHILGDTLRAIAGEKGGIIKPGVPVVIGERKPQATERLLEIAAERQAPVLLSGRDFEPLEHTVETGADGNWQQANRVRFRGQELELRTGIVGRHQAGNVAVAWAVLSLLPERGLPVAAAAAREGLRLATWPARLQRLNGIVFDAAHNPAGMETTVASLQQLQPGQRYHVMLGFLKDKQWQEALEFLVPICKSLRILRIDNPRTADPRVIRDHVRQRWPDLPVKTCRSVDTGLRQIQSLGDGLVLGSIYFVGDVLQHFYRGNPVDL